MRKFLDDLIDFLWEIVTPALITGGLTWIILSMGCAAPPSWRRHEVSIPRPPAVSCGVARRAGVDYVARSLRSSPCPGDSGREYFRRSTPKNR